MGNAKRPNRGLVDFEVIEAALSGEPDAFQVIHKHFEGYIAANSRRFFFDEFGQTYECVDQEMKKFIENKLDERILKAFRIR